MLEFEIVGGRQFVFVPGFKVLDEIAYSFEVFDGLPCTLTGRVSLPFDFILYEFCIKLLILESRMRLPMMRSTLYSSVI